MVLLPWDHEGCQVGCVDGEEDDSEESPDTGHEPGGRWEQETRLVEHSVRTLIIEHIKKCQCVLQHVASSYTRPFFLRHRHHSLNHLVTQSLSHSLSQSLRHLVIQSLTQALTQSLT